MLSEPEWLDANLLIDLNFYQVEQTGESHQLLFKDKLEAALERPKNLYYYDGQDDLVILTTMLMIAVGQAHAFEQGNKRTAFAAGIAFLRINGYELNPSLDSEYLADALTAAIIGDAPEFDALYDLLHDFVEEAP
ncbi:type II toxin-antitoxin system death-on-curing family toxin [Martelella sp. FLE1502]